MRRTFYLKKILSLASKINFKKIDLLKLFNSNNFSPTDVLNSFFNLDNLTQKEFLSLLAIQEEELNSEHIFQFKKAVLIKLFSEPITTKSLVLLFRFQSQIPKALEKLDLPLILEQVYTLRSNPAISRTKKKIADVFFRMIIGALLQQRTEIKIKALDTHFLDYVTNLLPFHKVCGLPQNELLISKLGQSQISKNNKLNQVLEATSELVQGDIHGALEKFQDNLYRAGLTDEFGHFKAKGKRLILLGDYISGGKFSFETYNYIKQLKREAAILGSEVIILAGNHDLDVFLGPKHKRAIFTYAFYIDKKLNTHLTNAFKKLIAKDIKQGLVQGFFWDEKNSNLYSHGGFTKGVWDLFLKEQNLIKKAVPEIIAKANEVFANFDTNLDSVLFKENHVFNTIENGPFWTDMRARWKAKEPVKPSFFRFNPRVTEPFFQVIGHIRTFLVAENSPAKYLSDPHGIKLKYSMKTNGLGGTVFCDTGLSNLKDHKGGKAKKNQQNQYLFEGLQTMLLVNNKKFIELRNLNQGGADDWQLRIITK